MGHVHRSTLEINMDQIKFEDAPTGAETRTGVSVRIARIAKGYSLEDLAIATGLTEAEILAVEDGLTVDAHHVQRIEHALS
ncbi:helix-turn-helix domain-containing protein [Neorhizobium alkalisoli]|jgi:hypothetical protein|uniref:Helix-turn-helix protein n=1 Tax=Neorhizobium alkalisoli TaxID=528178 RepID=A0A561PZ23_9HYPH|nr:helix-turn-helix transcriptional regulator [Neorhizobium alkalisoli]TWF43367.1 hypothetical protein FHW37_12137 [Neorhizobium alkalisoli]